MNVMLAARSRTAARRVHTALLNVRDLLLSAGPLAFVAVGLVVLAYWWLQPNPPRRVVLATGPAQSAYAEFGQRYRQALAAEGIEVELKESEGSSANLQLLRGGAADLVSTPGAYDRAQEILDVSRRAELEARALEEARLTDSGERGQSSDQSTDQTTDEPSNQNREEQRA